MKLRELLLQSDIEEAWSFFNYYYNKEGKYKKEILFTMYNELLNIDAKDSDINYISVYNEGEYTYVSGLVDLDGETYGIEYNEWSEWIELEVLNTASIPHNQLLAHILFEISWNGWTQSSQKQNIESFIKRISNQNTR